jgi:hypothetical protein
MYIDENSVYTLMNKLFKENRNNDVVKVFCSYLNYYSINNKPVNESNNDTLQLIPSTHVNLATTALLKLVIYISHFFKSNFIQI